MADFRKPGVIMRKQNILLDTNLSGDGKVCMIKLSPCEILGQDIEITGKFKNGEEFKENIYVETVEEFNFKINNPDYQCDFFNGAINVSRKDDKKFNLLIAKAQSNGVIGPIHVTRNKNYVR